MSEPIFGDFINKKKANSEFLSMGDGESVKIANLREVKMVTKAGMGGEEKEVLRLVVDVQTSEGMKTKKFDNSSQNFAEQLQEKGIKLGSAFTITRTGEGLKTKYAISEVVNPTA